MSSCVHHRKLCSSAILAAIHMDGFTIKICGSIKSPRLGESQVMCNGGHSSEWLYTAIFGYMSMLRCTGVNLCMHDFIHRTLMYVMQLAIHFNGRLYTSSGKWNNIGILCIRQCLGALVYAWTMYSAKCTTCACLRWSTTAQIIHFYGWLYTSSVAPWAVE